MFNRLFVFVLFGLYVQSVLAKDLPDFTALVEKQGAAVVNVSTSQTIQASQGVPPIPGLPEGDPLAELFRRFGSPMPREQETHSLGSGFLISADGYILTNAHVVDAADKITVRLTDQREFKARVIGADRRTDVALIKIEATGLPKVVQGDPAQLRVGEWVLAIGSPFGFDSSVTAGIVSGKGRSLQQENFVPFIQTDVAINPGNSGGPLFNMKGEVVGINSQIYSRSGGYMGLSFAIPIDVAMEVANQLRASGKVTRGRIGVVIQEVTRELADSFGLNKASGALISAVEKGGPADKAGIQASDVILKFDGKVVAMSKDLPRIVAATQPGSKVAVQLWRKGATKEVSLTVAEMPGDGRTARASKHDSSGEQIARLGINVTELTGEQKSQLEIEGGLLIDEVRGANARGELQRGDIILDLGNTPIVSVEQLNNLLKTIPKGRTVALRVRRGETISYIPIKLDEK
ncbi:MAG: protease Do [Gallionellales bacterium 35-53-114]|jgi:serine protease Do|nr:MAG: protease Do [Gallionellales bacterium 35-53-114]OYZ63175.1 MAG: protease Do [Gallionellales bacterium 24-53-125]OZB08641.1 MAG: protease Do [Gallionellales bacterium 39-52-133]HQS57504.1 DegQ family serine endoprotease [Gallionellaceae bacterium]HQS74308.1 DegQ family serine endoprotease [Gallionellaceae bacterium]